MPANLTLHIALQEYSACMEVEVLKAFSLKILNDDPVIQAGF